MEDPNHGDLHSLLGEFLSSPYGIVLIVLSIYVFFKVLKIDGPLADARKIGREFLQLARGIKSLESLNAFVLCLSFILAAVGLLSTSVFRIAFSHQTPVDELLPSKYDVLGCAFAIAFLGILCVRSIKK